MGFRLAWVFFFQILFFKVSYAQIQIEGTVKNSTGIPVTFATVSIVNPHNGTILFFDSSDKNGDYSITISNQSNITDLSLQITCLGYQKEIIPLQKNINQYNIILKEESKDLEPVVIKGDPHRLNLNGDTLSYD